MCGYTTPLMRQIHVINQRKISKVMLSFTSPSAVPRSSGSAGGGAAGDGAGEGGSDDEEEQVRRALALISALDPPL